MTLRLKLNILALFAGVLIYPGNVNAAGKLACNGEFEGDTVRIIVSHSTGGGYDTSARIFAPHYEKATGARVIVENWPAGKGRVGLVKIMDAEPDGLTIGVMDASRRIVDHMLNADKQPDILEKLTLLARFARSRHVLLTGAQSGVDNIDALFKMDPQPVFGTNSYRSLGFLATALVGDLLQLKFNTVSGLGGTRKRVLAASRNDVDFISSNYSSISSDIQTGAIRPLLQNSTTLISDDSSLSNIPILGGPDGVAARRAAELGISVQQSIERAQAIETLISAGRLIVAPAGLPDHITVCLQDTVFKTLQSDDFVKDISRSNMVLDIASGPSTALELKNSQAKFEQLVPILKEHTAKK